MTEKAMNHEEKLLEGMKQSAEANEVLVKRNEMIKSLGVQAALTGIAIGLTREVLPMSWSARELNSAYMEAIAELLRLSDMMCEQEVKFL